MLQFRAIALAVAGSLALAAPAFAGKLSIVIDDFGYRPQTENQVLALPSTISVAVLPNAPHAREMATKAHNQGHEVLIHLPMAPLSKQPLTRGIVSAIGAFFKWYLFSGAWRYGKVGVVTGLYATFYSFLKYFKAWYAHEDNQAPVAQKRTDP